MVVSVETIDFISWALVFVLFFLGLYFLLRFFSKLGDPKFRFKTEFWTLLLLFGVCVGVGVAWTIQLVKFDNETQRKNEESSLRLFSDSFQTDMKTVDLTLDVFKRVSRTHNRDNIVWTNPGTGSVFLPFMEKTANEESYLRYHVFQPDKEKNDFIKAVARKVESLNINQLYTVNFEPYSKRKRLDEKGEITKKGKFFAEPVQNNMVGHKGSTVRIIVIETPFSKEHGVLETLKGMSRVLLHSKNPPIFVKIPKEQREEVETWMQDNKYKEYTYLIGKAEAYFSEFRLFMTKKQDMKEVT
jgi:hypothetical protein